MQYKKLTPAQRRTLKWRGRRNSIVSSLLAGDKFLRREVALKMANKIMREKRPC